MLPFVLPRHVQPKPLKRGGVGFYYVVPTIYRRAGCTVPNQALGTDYTAACGTDGKGGRAAALNALFDEWRNNSRGVQVVGPREPITGSVGWAFKIYRGGKSYLEKVAPRSRPDYQRTMLLVENIITKKGDKLRDRPIKSISPRAADKIYDLILNGPHGERPRQAEKSVALCRRVWRVVHRLYPNEFDQRVPKPLPIAHLTH